MIDTHAHLDARHFGHDRRDAIRRAREAGLVAIVDPASNFSSNARIAKIAEENKNYVFACAGIDPISALREQKLNEAVEYVKSHSNEIVAIGEVGLDFYWSKEKQKQLDNFNAFISLSKELGKPLIIHARDAMKDTLSALKASRAERVILHCFSGDAAEMHEAVDRGYYISFATNVCYRGDAGKSLIKETPLEYMLLETDSPYLHPLRSGRNEPANVRYALDYVAAALGEEAARIEKQTDKNARSAFGLKV